MYLLVGEEDGTFDVGSALVEAEAWGTGEGPGIVKINGRGGWEGDQEAGVDTVAQREGEGEERKDDWGFEGLE